MERFLNDQINITNALLMIFALPCPKLDLDERESLNVLSIDLDLRLSIKSHIEPRSHWRLCEMTSVDTPDMNETFF